MDFFDTLRKGCAFGKAERSKKVAFGKTPTGPSAKPLEAAAAAGASGFGTSSSSSSSSLSLKKKKNTGGASTASTLDFFGYGGPSDEVKLEEGDADGDDDENASDADSDEGDNDAEEDEVAEEAADAHVNGSSKKKKRDKRNALSASAQDTKAARRKQHEVAVLRKQHRLHVGPGAPDPIATFDEMPRHGVPEWLVQNLRGLGFAAPTPIQMQCFPAILSGSHLLASAPTGSGKTIAFLAPLLAKLGKPGKEFARAVVVDPSRELAKQTLDEFAKLTKGRKWTGRLVDKGLDGGGKSGSALKRLDVAVATPLRLAALLKEGRLSLDQTRHLVLDEADKLLDLGFAPQIDEILSYCPKDRGLALQTLLFSATLPQGVVELAKSILTNPLRVAVGEVNAAAADVEQTLTFITDEEHKLFSFRQLVQEGKVKPPCLIFVQSKDRAKQLFSELVYDGIFVDAIHGDRTKAQRDNSIKAFREGRTWMLICTDVLARGVDFKGVETVVNYDFPQSSQTYIHRIGRTGRAGHKGKAITLFTIEDFENLRTIVGVMRQSGCEVPEWMLRLKPKPKGKAQRRMGEFRPPERKKVSTVSKWELRKAKKKKEMKEASLKRKRVQQREERKRAKIDDSAAA